MDLVRPWLIALVVSVALHTAYLYVLGGIASVSTLSTFSGRTLYLTVPAILFAAITATVAALTHRAPERNRPGRHALAALGIPVLFWIKGLIGAIGAVSIAVMVTSTLAQALGAAGGLLIALQLRSRFQARVSGPRYY